MKCREREYRRNSYQFQGPIISRKMGLLEKEISIAFAALRDFMRSNLLNKSAQLLRISFDT
jgi:hypothetical protein